MADTRRAVTVDGGVRLAVREFPDPGTGAPPLVLHHGLASSQRIWDLTLPSLVRHHRVVTYDARGHGRSSKPSSGYGFERTTSDLRAIVRATRLRRPVVIGHSWGAMVALEAAVRFPRSFAGVVLIDGGVTPMRRSFPSWTAAKEALAPPHLAGTPVEEFRAMIRTFFADFVDVTPDVEDIILSVMRVDRAGRIRPNLSRANHFRILRTIWLQDPLALHAALRVPTLAILAHRSAQAEDAAWELAKRSAAAELRETGSPTRVRWVEGIHDVPLQHPEALAALIRRWARTAVR
jgi:pimeloyl-ACP methyl ester carboxylesterase